MMMNKLDFEVDGIKYYVRMPNQRDINEGDLVYKTKYSEALRFGALTHAEAFRIIEERKIFGREDEKKIRDLFFELNELGKKLNDTSKLQDAAMIMFDMEKLRTQIVEITLRKNNILDNTAESYADEHRLQFYTVACTFDHNNKHVFANVDEYIDRASEELAQVAITKTIHLIANEGKDFRYEWPEYQWRLKHGFIDEELKPIPGKTEEAIEAAQAELKEVFENKEKAALTTIPKKKSRSRKTK